MKSNTHIALALAFSGLLFAPVVMAGAPGDGTRSSSVVSIADREIARRQAGLQRAEQLIAEAREARRSGDWETAYVRMLDAVQLIPAGEAGEGRRQAAVDEFSSIAMGYAEHLISRGEFADAEQVAKTILLPEFNPTYRPAVRLLSNLEQPDYYNKTITPSFAGQVDEVVRLLQEAQGFYASGRFDLATRRYNQVLAIDPYNKAAREGMEAVDSQRQAYYGSAYNETRSRLLWEVTKAWERPIPRAQRPDGLLAPDQGEARKTEAILSKLNRIIIPRVNLQNTTIREAVDFLKQQSVRLDTTPDEAQRGVNIVPRFESRPRGEDPLDLGDGIGPTEATRVSLNLRNVPLYEALRYLAELSQLRIKVEPNLVALVPLSEPVDALIQREYRVPPGFIPPSPPEETAGFAAMPLRGEVRTPGPGIGTRLNAQRFLEEQGVTFPPGASAQYIPTGSKLVVRNTPDNIDVIDSLVDAAVGVPPTQIQIESKFLEVSQNNLRELGFDWLLGPFSIGNGTYMAGGDTSVNPSEWPFDTSGQYAVTQGLRTGSGTNPLAAVTTNSVDALLAANAGGLIGSGVAPGIFGISGIFTNPQFQVVIRALDQKKGVDLLSAPTVTTKSGQIASVRIIRKFFYPTQFTPPEVPTSTSTTSGSGTTVVNPLLQSPPTVTPAFPDLFESRDIGVILEVTPVVGPDSYTIELNNLSPQVVDFDGFINYGSSINAVGWTRGSFQELLTGQNVLGLVPVPIVLTPNVINQPIFSTRRVTTNVTIWDGQTVAIGGLLREDVQKVQDKVPVLGDVPLVGRLFRSDVDQKIKKNLIIFVTAQIIDAEGNPIRRDEDEEEFVDPLGLPEMLPGPSFPTYKGGGFRGK